MSVIVPDNAFGSFLRSTTGQKVRYVDGALYTSTPLTLRTNQWARTDKSSNPLDAERHRTCSPYSRYCRVAKHHSGYNEFTTGGHQYRDEYPGLEWIYYDAAMGGQPFYGGPFLPDINGLNRAVTECLVKLGNQKIELGAALAESKSTLMMIATNSIDLLRGLRSIKNGQLPYMRGFPRLGANRLRRAQRNASNRYLEFQFGWAPLCADIYSGVELLRKGFDDRSQEFSVNRTIVERYEGRNGSNANANALNNWYQNDLSSSCKLWAKVKGSYLDKARALGLINPLSIGWEVIPYSFVVDWFLPIGNLLEASTATVGVDFVRGYKGQRGTSKVSSSLKVTSGIAPRCDQDVIAYKRTKLTSFPWPVPYVKSPLSTTHALEALSLLRQLV